MSLRDGARYLRRKLYDFGYALAGLAPVLALRSAGGDVAAAHHRHLRARLLRQQAARLARVMAAADFRGSLLVRADGNLFVGSGGVFLSAAGTDRYLKTAGGRVGNEGAGMLAFLRSHDIEPRTIVDVGANFGEVSLYFARELPEARVIAIEPVPENLQILRENLAIQAFDAGRIEVVDVAVGDRQGTIAISSGLGSENSVILDARNRKIPKGVKTTVVQMMTLSEILEKHQVGTVDFLKIDIEGAEPMLHDSLFEWAGKVRAIFIEFSVKNEENLYKELLRMLISSGFIPYSENGELMPGYAHAFGYVQRFFRERVGCNIWFVR